VRWMVFTGRSGKIIDENFWVGNREGKNQRGRLRSTGEG
jgi:hypothetical protein